MNLLVALEADYIRLDGYLVATTVLEHISTPGWLSINKRLPDRESLPHGLQTCSVRSDLSV